jgi:peroxiredoxin
MNLGFRELALVPVLLGGLMSITLSAAEASPPKREVESALGRRIPHFVLPDAQGEQRALNHWRGQQALVLVFMGTECPIGNRYLPVLDALQQKYQDGRVQVLLVYANPADTAEDVARHVQQFQTKLPALIDKEQMLLRVAGAARTPEVVVLDARRVIRYQGRIDDRFGYDYQRETPQRADLELAVAEVLERKEVSVPQTTVAGCLIKRVPSRRPAGDVTYAGQVARIVQEKCQSCHRPGAVAPFSLLAADDAVNWADMIKQVVLERRMPPWHADHRYGSFTNDRSLTPAELDTLVDWVDAGAPLGDLQQAPPPRQFASTWTIGEPDVVFRLPKEVTVPATGVVAYQYYETPTNFKEDVWIQAAECRPGNRAAVHHIICFYRVPGQQRQGIDERRLGDQWIAGTAPGDVALILPPGMARKIPAGAVLIWQMHYTPTGKVETDRSEIGLVFYKGQEPPQRNVHTRGVVNPAFRIPAGAANHQVRSNLILPRDVLLLGFMPHMHLRGKDFEYTAIYPDGQRETLLSVPRFDFDWQSSYRLSAAKRLPKGTEIKCVAHFDNSVDNPANPDPHRDVRWGDQTWEEMMIGYIDYALADPEPGDTAGTRRDQRDGGAGQ